MGQRRQQNECIYGEKKLRIFYELFPIAETSRETLVRQRQTKKRQLNKDMMTGNSSTM